MILSDTGVFVAAINKADKNHARCAKILQSVKQRPVTTWPCITETMYLLGSQANPQAQETMRRYIERQAVVVHEAGHDEARRVCELMRKYADSPMDFADASLVAAAESLGVTKILTLDRHFFAYRINDQIPFDLLQIN